MRVRGASFLATGGLARAFTRSDGRERVAVPTLDGLLSGAAAVGIGLLVAIGAMLAILVAVILILGRTPSTEPGHLFLGSAGLICYLATGAVAWARLRRLRPTVFRPLVRGDLRALCAGAGALLAVKVATAIQLFMTAQTHHVQGGFEHYDVVTRVPLITAATISVALVSLVVAGPLVEEIVFRGLLFGALAGRIGVFAGALATGLLFGAMHGDAVLFPSLAAMGFIAALAYAWSGNLWVPVILHALNNALGAFVLLGDSLGRH